ncbi:MAG: phage tail sheath subtilisin-like domain-containing protein [Methanobrevibacter sp.]|nr:phage tail sheath subtilisin-like domain-containing protein [Methanobrevibacter sp.]
MASEPDIDVFEKGITTYDNIPGMASTIAVIGAFDSDITSVTNVSTARDAHDLFGTTSTVGTFKGTDDIDFLFKGASNLLIVNTTTWSTANPPVASTTLTNEKLTEALSKLKGEYFDILFIAEELSDSAQTLVSAWLDEEFENKNSHGQVSQLSKSTAGAYTTSVATYNKNIYYINTQILTINGVELDLNRSTAYICGLIASMNVSSSLTNKIIEDVTAVSPEYTTESGDLGHTLLNLNIPFIKCKNRRRNEYICLNSQLPNGYDLYINRVRDYVLKMIYIETFLGEQSTEVTVGGIDNIIESVRQTYVEELNLLKDIIYSVEKKSSECVEVYIDSLKFNGIVTKINIYYSIEVE